MPESVAEFWWMLDRALGGALPWVLVCLGLAGGGVLFHGRIAARWVFPVVLALGGAWIFRRWLWQYF